MPYDQRLAERVRWFLRERPGVSERKMFGGLCFMVNGHMCCGVAGEDLVLRLGEERAAEALERPHARPLDFTGRPMKSMIYVSLAGLGNEESLGGWLEQALAFVGTLPSKG
ncbi:MAG TPA: TfoX/Sxy family protein [Acidobacteriota bacterium]|nr:TfoX/Sxy family protein [Acidobacteriota bacterium]